MRTIAGLQWYHLLIVVVLAFPSPATFAQPGFAIGQFIGTFVVLYLAMRIAVGMWRWGRPKSEQEADEVPS